MAGMLPGVESARRRRFHNSSNLTSHELSSTYSTWRSYTTTTHHFHSNSSTTRSSLIRQQGLCDDDSRLSAAAIQAKKRLDQRLHLPHTHRIDQFRSMNIDHEQERPTRSSINNRPPPPTNTHRLNLQDDDNQVPNKLKKSGSKRLNWLKMSWKSSEQDECAVCLEQFVKAAGGGGGGKSGGTLMQVPCGHRFHTNCLMPWLEANAHCPCCRMEIPSSK